jgi:DNA processing protein
LTETAADVIDQHGPILQGRVPPRLALPAPRGRAFEEPFSAPFSAPALPPALQGPISDDDALDLLLEHLSPTPVAVDELVRQCQMSAASVATLLLELELAGRIERHPGNLVSLR